MLAAARKHAARSALLAQRAGDAAARRAGRGQLAVAAVLIPYQAAQAQQSEAAVAAMLAEQDLDVPPVASLQASAFTTSTKTLQRMLEQVTVPVELLVASLVQDAGRAAESVATAARPGAGHVRQVNPPCCSRCAALAGQVYRWSDGFQRHPRCDCTMVTTAGRSARALVTDSASLVAQGLVRGLAKADLQAVTDGVDLGRVVNVRRKAAGLRESGRVLARAGRPTPEAIYRLASDQADAVRLLRKHGYLH